MSFKERVEITPSYIPTKHRPQGPRCFLTSWGLWGPDKVLYPQQQSQLVTGLNAYLARSDGDHYPSVER